MVRTLLMLSLLALSGCMPNGGPSPRAVLVIPSSRHELSQVLEALDEVPGLGARIDKRPEFQYYDSAYWYPHNGSDTYGVGLVRWASDLQGDGSEEMKDRYFVDVYAEEEACSLCDSVKATLKARNIRFFAACENPQKSTGYERIRCGT